MSPKILPKSVYKFCEIFTYSLNGLNWFVHIQDLTKWQNDCTSIISVSLILQILILRSSISRTACVNMMKIKHHLGKLIKHWLSIFNFHVEGRIILAHGQRHLAGKQELATFT